MSLTPEKSKRKTLRRWIVECVLGILANGFVFYGFFHLLLGISVHKLLEPYVIVSIVLLLFGPAMYWALGDAAPPLRKSRKRVFWVVGVYLWFFAFVIYYYGVRVGFIAPGDFIPLELFMTVIIPLGLVIGYRSLGSLYLDKGDSTGDSKREASWLKWFP